LSNTRLRLGSWFDAGRDQYSFEAETLRNRTKAAIGMITV
jgi:hypothetical protein